MSLPASARLSLSGSDDRMALEVGGDGSAVHSAVEGVHGPAAGALEPEGEDGVDEAGDSAGDHPEAETGRVAEMLAIAFADFDRVPREGIVRHVRPIIAPAPEPPVNSGPPGGQAVGGA